MREGCMVWEGIPAAPPALQCTALLPLWLEAPENTQEPASPTPTVGPEPWGWHKLLPYKPLLGK